MIPTASPGILKVGRLNGRPRRRIGFGRGSRKINKPMADTTPLHNPALPREESPAARPARGSAALKLWTILRRSIFWSYERGSWQYDLIVVLILAFIFFSRPLFHDQPALELSNLRHEPGVVEVSQDKLSHTYQIDARLLESLNASTPEEAAQTILKKTLNRTVAVQSVEKIRDRRDSEVVLGYKVVVKP